MKHYFTLTALDALILSQSNSTTGGHLTLDFIPGSAILGALACKYYPEDDTLAWSLFHSGQVIFSNCYPVTNGRLGLPTPLSWHCEKGDKNSDSIKSWVNQASHLFTRKQNVQYEQLRGKYIFSNGNRSGPGISISTKTAIDHESGTAKSGQLFNYQHINAGQHFLGWIECPNELDNEIIQWLNGYLRIGRSKGSEFGRVQISPALIANDWQSPSDALSNQITIWCISDIECLDEFGGPTLSPKPKNIHPSLKSSELVPEQTFIRYHSVNRFNSHRQCFDSESRLITKGSVITLQLTDNANTTEIIAQLSQGIGINRHLGYGQVIINPNWASQLTPLSPVFFVDTVNIEKPTYIHTHPTPLTRWVEARLETFSTHQNMHLDAISLVENIVKAYSSARKFNHISDAYQIGPSRSQWRRINDLLRSEHSDEWLSRTFQCKNPIVKSKNDPLGWGAQWIQSGQSVTFEEYCHRFMAKCSITTLLKALEILTRANPAENDGLQRIKSSLDDEKSVTKNQQWNQGGLS